MAAMAAVKTGGECKGIGYLGVVPTEKQLQIIGDRRLLVVAGTMDGVSRFSRFAVARHIFFKR